MSLRESYATDPEKEVNGVEVVIDDGVYFTLRRAGGANKEWQKQLDRVTKPWRRQMQLGAMKEEVAAPLYREAFVKANMIAWRGVSQYDVTGKVEDKDTPFTFTHANAIALFDALPESYIKAQEASRDIENFRENALEEEAGN